MDIVDKFGCVVVVGGSQGYNELISSIMNLCNSNKFQVISISVDDLHDEQKFINVVKKIKKQRNGRNMYGVGVQYGANLLTIASAKEEKLFNGIVSLGNPLDLQIAQKQVQNSNIAKWSFLERMTKGRIQKSPNNNKTQKNIQQFQFSNLSSFLYSIPQDQLSKFKQNHSSINVLKLLKIPSLFLNSKQDPFSISLQEDERIQGNPLLLFVSTKHGGHTQWFYSLTPTRWAARLTVTHLKNLHKLLIEEPNIIDKELYIYGKQTKK